VALGNEAMQRRTVMVSDIEMLVSRSLLQEGILNELKGINGYKNVAFDLFQLSDIYRKNWDKIADRTSIKKEELDQVEDLADKLVTAAGLRDQAPTRHPSSRPKLLAIARPRSRSSSTRLDA
jgi:hypothetical protein